MADHSGLYIVVQLNPNKLSYWLFSCDNTNGGPSHFYIPTHSSGTVIKDTASIHLWHSERIYVYAVGNLVNIIGYRLEKKITLMKLLKGHML